MKSRVCALLTLLLITSATLSAQDPVKVQMKTSEGTIVLELDPVKAPKSVENFLKYVEKGHFKGTIFHRVIKGFMIQGGGFDKDMKKKEVMAPIRNEAGNGLRNAKYTIAMARTSFPHSATAQFYINSASNRSLDRDQAQDGWGYAVFGKVVEGQEVVDKIEATRTRTVPDPAAPSRLMSDVPVSPITITDVKVLK